MQNVEGAFERITAAVRDGRPLEAVLDELTQVTLYVMRSANGHEAAAVPGGEEAPYHRDGEGAWQAPGAVHLIERDGDSAGAAVSSVFNGWATMTLTALQRAAAAEKKCVQLEEAIASRDVIGQAKGILMERRKLTADDAFDVLRTTSQHLNMKLRDVATILAETGELPAGRGAQDRPSRSN